MTEIIITVFVAILVYILLAAFIAPVVGIVGAILVLLVGFGSART